MLFPHSQTFPHVGSASGNSGNRMIKPILEGTWAVFPTFPDENQTGCVCACARSARDTRVVHTMQGSHWIDRPERTLYHVRAHVGETMWEKWECGKKGSFSA